MYADMPDAYGRPSPYARQNGAYPERGSNRAFRDWEPEALPAAYARAPRYVDERQEDCGDY